MFITTNLNTITILKGKKKETKRRANVFHNSQSKTLKLVKEREKSRKNHYVKVSTEDTKGRIINCDQAKV